MSGTPQILVMARAPRPGRTKTRLEPMLGPAGCAQLQAVLIARAAATACQAAPGAVHFVLDPPGSAGEVGALLPSGVAVFEQCGNDLGQRMAHAVARVHAEHGGPIVVIGTDIPALTADHLRAALALLEGGADAVFGPAFDGGYYLVAVHRPVAALFDLDPVLWGGSMVLAASLTAARAARLRVSLLARLRDLDTPADALALLVDGGLPVEIERVLRVQVGAA